MKERKIYYYSVNDGIQMFLPCLSFYNDDDDDGADYGDDLRFELLMMIFTFIWKPLYRYFPLRLFLFHIHSIGNVFVHSSHFVLALNNGYYTASDHYKYIITTMWSSQCHHMCTRFVLFNWISVADDKYEFLGHNKKSRFVHCERKIFIFDPIGVKIELIIIRNLELIFFHFYQFPIRETLMFLGLRG